MTEQEWLNGTDPTPMLRFLHGKASERKLRLLGVACARASWNLLEDDRSRRAVEAAEQYADGIVDVTKLEAAVDAAWDVRDELWDAGPENHDDRLWVAEAAALTASVYEWRITFNQPGPSDGYPFRLPSPAHCDFLRCIFGNPFRSVPADLAWFTPTVVALAEVIYADRAFDRLPIVADSLEEAGCDNADLLTHCRGPGPHVRGCWVVDLLLGKE